MGHKKILKNLFLGDQFSEIHGAQKQIRISDIYFNIYDQNPDFVYKNKHFVLLKKSIALNILDIHDVSNISQIPFIAGLKFLDENQNELVYVHCQLGVSRSPTLIFMYLVATKQLKELTCDENLKVFIKKYYPYMKLNQGAYDFLHLHFPYDKLYLKSKQKWKDLDE